MQRKGLLTDELLTQQQGEVLKIGFLKKRGHIRRNWLDRWFVLTTEGIYYYKNRLDVKPVGVVPLFGSTVKEDTFQDRQYVFTCWTAEGKDYPIQACTRDEMLLWISIITNACVERNKRPASSTAARSVNPSSVSMSLAPPSLATGYDASRKIDSDPEHDD